MKKTKTALLILSYGLLFSSLFLTYIEVRSNYVALSESLHTYDMKGVSIVALTTIAGILLHLMNFRVLKIIVDIITTLLYSYTLYITYQIFLNETSAITISLNMGFYLYLISFIIFVVSLFLIIKKKKIINTNDSEINEIIKNINVNNYLFCNSLMGIKELDYGDLVLLINEDKNKKLIIEYKLGETGIKEEVNYSEIKSISFKPRLVMDNKLNKIEYKKEHDNGEEVANFLLAFSFAGTSPMGYTIAKGLKDSAVPITNNIKFDKLFEVSIHLHNEKKYEFETTNEPDLFTNKINNDIK